MSAVLTDDESNAASCELLVFCSLLAGKAKVLLIVQIAIDHVGDVGLAVLAVLVLSIFHVVFVGQIGPNLRCLACMAGFLLRLCLQHILQLYF